MPFSASITQCIVLNAMLILLAFAADSNNPYPYNSPQGGNQYGSYGQFYGNPPGSNGRGSAQDYRVDSSDGRRRANSRQITTLDQRPLQQPKKLDSGMFRDPDFCQERCEFDCQLQLYFAGRENEPEEQYYCAKLRPPPKALHEKLIDGFGRAGIFEFIVGGVIIFAVFVCCVCSCYQCCCKGRTFSTGATRRRGHYSSNEDAENGVAAGKIAGVGAHSLNGGTLSTSGMSPEHESLTNNNSQHMDDAIHAAPLPDKRFGINGGLHNNMNNHHFPRSNTGGGFSCRTQSDV